MRCSCFARVLSVAAAAAITACSGESEQVVADLPDSSSSEVAAEVSGSGESDSGSGELAAEVVAELAAEGELDVLQQDPGPQQGMPGWPCVVNNDCLSGYCIETPSGNLCTTTCMEECPFDWVCTQLPSTSPDPVYVCVPRFLDLCRPCKLNSDCGLYGGGSLTKCVSYEGAGFFCGEPCGDDGDCPQGYGFAGRLDVTGATVTQCVLTEGECECLQGYIDQAATTTCSLGNEWGQCSGERHCLAAGLTPCSAPIPAEETCNGNDDDCDGEVDEGFSDFDADGWKDCVDGAPNACEPLAGAKPEECDDIDNDCDGKVDEDFVDTEAFGEPLTFNGHHNLNQKKKMALSAVSTQGIFRRSSGVWLQVNHALFDQFLNTSTHQHYAVTVKASDGVTAAGFIGYSTVNVAGGGDYNVSMTDGGTCNGTPSQGVDHHSANYYHLNCGCMRHYLYSYSAQVGDGDAGYDANTGLGAWTATNGCHGEEGGGLVFYAAMR